MYGSQFQNQSPIVGSGTSMPHTGFVQRCIGWFGRLGLPAKMLLAGGVVILVGGGVVAGLLSKPHSPAVEVKLPTPSSQSEHSTAPADNTPVDQPKDTSPSTPPQTSTHQSKAGSTGGGTTAAPSGGGSSSGSGGGSTPSCALPNYPTASCTGVPAGTTLTISNGDLTITTAGTIIDGKDIRGCVIVQAANVTIRNSKITCTSFYGIASYAASDDGGLIVEDVEIDCDHHNSTGISYNGLTARRLHIHGCENGLDIYQNVTLTDSYIHDIYEGVSGHGDGIQAPDGSNTLIDHNTIYGESTTSAININNNASGPTTSNVTISNNLLAGGAYTLYCPIPPTANFKIQNNHFSTIFYSTVGAFGHSSDCSGETQSGNVIHETGQAITLQ